MLPPPPRSTLFPYTTLFRSGAKVPEDLPVRPVEEPDVAVRHVGDDQVTLLLVGRERDAAGGAAVRRDRKSTRLNSSHLVISYAVFCLKKKNKQNVRILSETV